MSAAVKKAVVPAAGVGTRMLPASKSVPKELMPILDRPLVHYIADECAQSGVTRLTFVCAPNKTAVPRYFAHDRDLDAFLRKHKRGYLAEPAYRLAEKLKVGVAFQNVPAGLGHAVLCARRAIGRDPFFAVVLPDDIIDAPTPCLKQMLPLQRKLGASLIALMEVPSHDVSRYGIVAGRPAGEGLLELTDMVEKPPAEEAPSRYAIVGRYILSRGIFACLQNAKRGALGEIQLTDAIRALLKEERVYGYVFHGARYDAGNAVGLLQANLAFARKRPEFSFLFRPPVPSGERE